MLKAGITGGIGSGKTLVCQVFETLGIPVFYADGAAKKLMQEDPVLMGQLQQLFGSELYTDGRLNRQYLSGIVFNDPGKLAALNALVHPAAIKYGNEWMQRQTTPYVIKEAALLFESGSYKELDVMIGVTAPEALRVQRVMQRDGIAETAVRARMRNQMDAAEKMRRCDHVIENDGIQAILPQIVALNQLLLEKAASGN